MRPSIVRADARGPSVCPATADGNVDFPSPRFPAISNGNGNFRKFPGPILGFLEIGLLYEFLTLEHPGARSVEDLGTRVPRRRRRDPPSILALSGHTLEDAHFQSRAGSLDAPLGRRVDATRMRLGPAFFFLGGIVARDRGRPSTDVTVTASCKASAPLSHDNDTACASQRALRYDATAGADSIANRS